MTTSKPTTLLAMQEASIEVESNLLVSKRLKVEEQRGGRGKKKVKDEKQASTSKQLESDDRLDEMANLIKGITTKFSKVDIENKPVAWPYQEGVNRNVVQYRKQYPPPPQILQWERRGNDNQRVQPPLNNYSQEVIKEDEEMEHEINMIGGYLQSSFLNKDEYEQQVAINQISDHNYEMVD